MVPTILVSACLQAHKYVDMYTYIHTYTQIYIHTHIMVVVMVNKIQPLVSSKQGTMVDRGGHETPGRRVQTSIHICTIYFMLHIKHVNTHTHTHTLLSLLLLD